MDAPPARVPLAHAPNDQITIIPICDDDPLAATMDAAAEAHENGHDS